MRSTKVKLTRAIPGFVLAILAIGTPYLFSPATDNRTDISPRQEPVRSSAFDAAPEAIDVARLLELPESDFSAPDIASLLKTDPREDFFAINRNTAVDQKHATHDQKGGNVQ